MFLNLRSITTYSQFQYGKMVADLAEHARSIVKDLDPTNELTFLRVKSVKHEVNCLIISHYNVMHFKIF